MTAVDLFDRLMSHPYTLVIHLYALKASPKSYCTLKSGSEAILNLCKLGLWKSVTLRKLFIWCS